MSKLLELADRVEGLSGPDREIDAEIYAAVSVGKWGCYSARLSSKRGAVVRYYENGRHGVATAPAYTRSIDDAKSLVPEGSLFTARTLWDRDKVVGFASVSRYETAGPDDALRRYWMDEHQGNAATPALALCAASLRAIAGGEG